MKDADNQYKFFMDEKTNEINKLKSVNTQLKNELEEKKESL